VIGIGALACSFAGLASPCLGQANVPTNGRPWFYLWGPPLQSGPSVTDFASQMVRVNAAQPATIAASQAAQAEKAQIDAGTTHPAKVCILLQNFGQHPPTGGSVNNPYSSILHELDKLNPLPMWNPSPPEFADMPYMQFWTEHGRAQAGQWMDDFLVAYESARGWLGQPAPVRFHFDNEIGLFGCCAKNYVVIAEAMTADPRWGDGPDPSKYRRVPGTKDYLYSSPLDKYMSDLWAEAKQAFGWDPTKTLKQVLDETAPGFDDDNREVFLWLNEIGQRAADAAMRECAYSRITNYYLNQGIPAPLCSNYNHYDADGASDTFGWYTGHDNTGVPLITQGSNNTIPPYSPQRLCARGAADQYGSGANYWWSDFIAGQTTPARSSLWSTTPGVASAYFSSPVLYPPVAEHYGTDFKRYYEPGWPQTNGGRVAITNGRRMVESIINTPGGSPSTIVPWVPALGAARNSNYAWTPLDMRDLLALLRAKNTPEIIIWWESNNPPNLPLPIHYKDFDVHRAIMDRVYNPKIDRIRLLSGSCQNCPTPPTQIQISKLEYTLRAENPSNEYVEVVTATPTPVVALQITFKDLNLHSGPLTINFEGAVGSASTGPIPQIRGNIYVWNGSSWVLQPIDDYTSDPDDSGFGFFAPNYGGSLPNNTWNETRRTFENIQKIVVNGKMDIKIVFTRRESNTPFIVRYDLVQLVDAEPAAQSMMAGTEQGADFNYTQDVSTEDISGFYAAYTAGEAAADFNNDGVVDAQDLAEFTIEYVNPK
jgi:hypothetical protein